MAIRSGPPSRSTARRLLRPVAALVGTAVLVVGCATQDVLVTSERSDRIQAVQPDDTTPDDTTVSTDPDRNATIDPVDPMETETTSPDIDTSTIDRDAIDFGDDKPARDYDDFLLAALADIDVWLQAEFEPAFGQPWRSLGDGVYAGYPERADDLPGCGEPTTSYPDLQLFVAFYCPLGDFIIYDDGEDGLLATLARNFGPATIGIVLAHEYGHAIQERVGVLQQNLPTVITEQQSDCVAGAWAGRAAADEASGLPFDDDDIRAGLISMITVQDPVGINPNEPGGHGSGFDRVGAFQVGFDNGLTRCAELVDDPLPLIPLSFLGEDDFANQGNATFGFGEGELFDFLVSDLNLRYDVDLDAEFPNFVPLTLRSTQSRSEVDCAQPFGLYDLGVELCSDTDTAYLNEPRARELYDEFGDFAPGYLLGIVWAEAAQRSNDSPLTGEERQLRNDCLVGAWVQSVIPVLDENGLPVLTEDGTIELPLPRDPERTSSISPNDLTEAVQTAILIGDPSSSTDVLGTPFQKIEVFRLGTLDGIDACT